MARRAGIRSQPQGLLRVLRGDGATTEIARRKICALRSAVIDKLRQALSVLDSVLDALYRHPSNLRHPNFGC